MKKVALKTQSEIKRLRKHGKSHRQIARSLNVSVGTAFKYSADIKLTEEQHRQLVIARYNRTLKNLPQQNIFTNPSINAPIEARLEWCRKGGRNTPTKFKKKYTERELLNILREFHRKHGRIPTKRDMPKICSATRRYFGSWNNAIIKAGFKPNSVLFASKQVAQDGHVCDSMAEKIIDDWLHKNNIDHDRGVNYPNSTLKTDFLVQDTYIEYFGLSGNSNKYDRYMKKKLSMIEEKGYKLIAIHPKDLFPKPKLDKLLGAFKE